MSKITRYWDCKLANLPFCIIPLGYAVLRSLIRKVVSRINLLRIGSHGQHCHIGLKVTLFYPGSITLGHHVSIGDFVRITGENGLKLFIDDNTWINQKVQLDGTGGIEIGKNCTISESVIIQTHSHGLDPRSQPQGMPLIIEDNVWLGMHCIVLPQVSRIGKNAIVGAGAIVTRDVPPNTVVAGNPAKIIRNIKS